MQHGCNTIAPLGAMKAWSSADLARDADRRPEPPAVRMMLDRVRMKKRTRHRPSFCCYEPLFNGSLVCSEACDDNY